MFLFLNNCRCSLSLPLFPIHHPTPWFWNSTSTLNINLMAQSLNHVIWCVAHFGVLCFSFKIIMQCMHWNAYAYDHKPSENGMRKENETQGKWKVHHSCKNRIVKYWKHPLAITDLIYDLTTNGANPVGRRRFFTTAGCYNGMCLKSAHHTWTLSDAHYFLSLYTYVCSCYHFYSLFCRISMPFFVVAVKFIIKMYFHSSKNYSMHFIRRSFHSISLGLMPHNP